MNAKRRKRTAAEKAEAKASAIQSIRTALAEADAAYTNHERVWFHLGAMTAHLESALAALEHDDRYAWLDERRERDADDTARVRDVLKESTMDGRAEGVSTLTKKLDIPRRRVRAALLTLKVEGKARNDDAGFAHLEEYEDGWWDVITPAEQRADDADIARQLYDEQRSSCGACGEPLNDPTKDGNKDICAKCDAEMSAAAAEMEEQEWGWMGDQEVSA